MCLGGAQKERGIFPHSGRHCRGAAERHLRPAPPRVQAKGVDLILPKDVVVADKFAADADSKIVPIDQIPEGWMVRCGQAWFRDFRPR